MISEQTAAIFEAQITTTAAAMTGHKDHVIVGKTLKVFGKRVRANKRRLSRS
jgi:hypothetical protein